jgi:hypothetical protein
MKKKEKIVILTTIEKRKILSFPNIFAEKMKIQFMGKKKKKKTHQLGIGTIILTCFVFLSLRTMQNIWTMIFFWGFWNMGLGFVMW